jgi:uncharacterized membrane protein YhaH (DUF805 family)
MNWPHMLFGLRGRIDRAKWWIASTILAIVLLVDLKLIDWFDLEALSARLSRFAAISLAFVLALASLLIVYCLLAVLLKRLHDRNRRGWWLLLFPLAPVVLANIVSTFAADLGTALTSALWAVVSIIVICALIELGLMPGTTGLNRYGTDPLAKVRGEQRLGTGP